MGQEDAQVRWLRSEVILRRGMPAPGLEIWAQTRLQAPSAEFQAAQEQPVQINGLFFAFLAIRPRLRTAQFVAQLLDPVVDFERLAL